MSWKKSLQSPLLAGLVLGVGAALVQAYFSVIPPTAYGVCMVCHPKDLFNWIANALFHTEWRISLASTAWPLLTVVGVVLGSMTAAYQHGELKLRASRQQVYYFINGFLMMNFGLILGSCPIRIVLLGAYGDWMAYAAWAAIVAGVFLGVKALQWSATRKIEQGGQQ